MSIPVNHSVAAYTGPFFELTGAGFIPLGTRLSLLRDACISHFSSNATLKGSEFVYSIPECIYGNSGEQMKANLSSHQYILTLWPAIISIIATMGIDAAPVAYHSLGWAIVLALTSGGMPGSRGARLLVEETSPEEAKNKCETWGQEVKGGQEAKVGFPPYVQYQSPYI